jgi:dTDP-4-dehydrorhamnose reductase
MRIAVTGSRGQLARSLVEAAQGPGGFEVITLGRRELDLLRPETIGPALRRAEPDIVINAAADTDVDAAEDRPERAFAVNAAGAAEVAKASFEIGVPIIQISTDFVFDGRKLGTYGEDDETNPLNVYGRSKREGERLVQAATSDHLIVRTSWLHSPFARNFVRTVLDLARAQDEIRTVADQNGCPTSATDFARGLLTASKRVLGGDSNLLARIFHLAGRGSCSRADLAEHVLSISRAAGGPRARTLRVATADYPSRAVRPHNSVLNSNQFEEAFEFHLSDWRDSVAETVRRILGAS